MLAAARVGNLELLREELRAIHPDDRKALVRTTRDEENGNTALLWAVENGHPECVAELIKEGADPNGKTSCTPAGRTNVRGAGVSALAMAMFPRLSVRSAQQTPMLLKVLVEAGADVNERLEPKDKPESKYRTLLHGAAILNRRDSPDHDFAACLAALKASPDYLIINASDNDGKTALHLCIMHGVSVPNDRDRRVKALLEAGACANVQDHEGQTPLHLALASNALVCVQHLVAYGAYDWMKNSEDKTPRDYCDTEEKLAVLNGGQATAAAAHTVADDTSPPTERNYEQLVAEHLASGLQLNGDLAAPQGRSLPRSGSSSQISDICISATYASSDVIAVNMETILNASLVCSPQPALDQTPQKDEEEPPVEGAGSVAQRGMSMRAFAVVFAIAVAVTCLALYLQSTDTKPNSKAEAYTTPGQPTTAATIGTHNAVTIGTHNGVSRFLVNGEPFVVNGVSGRYTASNLALLKSWGGNTIRTYHEYDNKLQETLDMAQAAGLMVVVGMGLSWKASGTNMDSETTRIIGIVNDFKKHPAVLCWNIANEREHYSRSERAPMDAYVKDLNALASAVKAADPTHPVIATFIDFGTIRNPPMSVVAALQQHGIAYDAVGINCYGTHAKTLATRWAQIGLKKPFLVTEMGWNPAYMGNPVVWSNKQEGITHEATSTEKAEIFREAMTALTASKDCLGTMAFRWDQRSPHTEPDGQTLPSETWHMLFVPDNNFRTDIAEELIKGWTGAYPLQRAPKITSQVKIDYKHFENNKLTSKTWRGLQVTTKLPNEVASSQNVTARVTATATQKLSYRWELRHHNRNDRSNPSAPTSRRGAMVSSVIAVPSVTFTAPAQRGPYRLYLFVEDIAARTSAHASWPFRVV